MSDLKNYDIILSPVITEKATKLYGSEPGRFPRAASMRRSPRSRKRSKALFKVKVKAVNTVRVKGKTKMFRGRAFANAAITRKPS